MYCVRCGVKLADSENSCPLCGTRVFHPDILREESEPLYPAQKFPAARKRTFVFQALFTAAFILPFIIVLLCDIQFNRAVTWSGYVMGALILGYISFILPSWFRKPNPVIFVPCDVAAVALYLFYINIVTGGKWFWSFGLPVVGCVGAIVITVVTLTYYLKRGKLFVFGGATIALGAFMLLMEFLMVVTFEGLYFKGWSLYPLITLGIIGGLLIFIGACRPAKKSMERMFFV
ncbi:MAG: hypothetical protein IJX27_04800 [Clostridia bacterium]|nr:hypothetical protein [Clostridia bacterium]